MASELVEGAGLVESAVRRKRTLREMKVERAAAAASAQAMLRR